MLPILRTVKDQSQNSFQPAKGRIYALQGRIDGTRLGGGHGVPGRQQIYFQPRQVNTIGSKLRSGLQINGLWGAGLGYILANIWGCISASNVERVQQIFCNFVRIGAAILLVSLLVLVQVILLPREWSRAYALPMQMSRQSP